MKKSYFGVLNSMREIALSGFSEVFIGDIWEVEAVARKYPLLVMDPNYKTHTLQNGVFTLRVDLYAVDLVYQDDSNELDILSDMTGSMIMYINFLSDTLTDYYFYVRKNTGEIISLETFTEKWDDRVSGCKAELEIKIPDDGSLCKNIFSYG